MKKTSMLAALALVVTIGGAYATWNYAEGAMESVISQGKTIDITLAQTNTASGTIKFHNSLVLYIDDEGTGKADVANYTPGWDDYYGPGGEGESNAGQLVIEFVPAAGATTVTLSYRIFIKEGTNAYVDWINGDKTKTQNVKIFDVADDTKVIEGTFKYDYLLSQSEDPDVAAANSGKVIISYTDFIAALKVNDDFTVSTAEEYKHYAEALSKVLIQAEVKEVTEQTE